MSGAGVYSPENYERIYEKYTRQQCKKGGSTRARTGIRHPLYKFFVKDDTVSIPDGYVHGRAGGLARQRQIRQQKEQQ